MAAAFASAAAPSCLYAISSSKATLAARDISIHFGLIPSMTYLTISPTSVWVSPHHEFAREGTPLTPLGRAVPELVEGECIAACATSLDASPPAR